MKSDYEINARRVFSRFCHGKNKEENAEVDHGLRKYFLWAYRNI